MGTVVYIGSLTIGGCIPIAVECDVVIGALISASASASAQLTANIDLTLPDIEAQLAAALQMSAAFTLGLPEVTAQIEAAAQVLASLEINGPQVSLQATALLDVIASLTASLGSLNASVAFAAQLDASIRAAAAFQARLSALLGGAGVHLYTYSGPANELGDSFQAVLSGGFPSGGGSDQTNAVLLATTIPSTWAKLSVVFKIE